MIKEEAAWIVVSLFAIALSVLTSVLPYYFGFRFLSLAPTWFPLISVMIFPIFLYIKKKQKTAIILAVVGFLLVLYLKLMQLSFEYDWIRTFFTFGEERNIFIIIFNSIVVVTMYFKRYYTRRTHPV